MKPLILAMTLLLSAGLLGATADAQQLAKGGKYTGKFGSQAVFQPYELEKGHVFLVGMVHGVFFNDVADGFLDKTEVTCPITDDIVDGVSIAEHGYCIITDKDGDKAFSVFQGKGTAPGSIGGTFKWTGGTGKFSGIQGNNTYRVTVIGKTTAAWVAWEGEWRMP
jgi:hypothetical protein